MADAVVSGNTCYYFTLEGDSHVYTAFIDVNERLPFMQPGTQLEFSYSEDGNVRSVTEIRSITNPSGPKAPAASPESGDAEVPETPAVPEDSETSASSADQLSEGALS